jgi:hypothetical protein
MGQVEIFFLEVRVVDDSERVLEIFGCDAELVTVDDGVQRFEDVAFRRRWRNRTKVALSVDMGFETGRDRQAEEGCRGWHLCEKSSSGLTRHCLQPRF